MRKYCSNMLNVDHLSFCSYCYACASVTKIDVILKKVGTLQLKNPFWANDCVESTLGIVIGLGQKIIILAAVYRVLMWM